MLKETIDDVIKYVQLKTYLETHKKDIIVEIAVDLIENAIKAKMEVDKERLIQIKKQEERIKAKQEGN